MNSDKMDQYIREKIQSLDRVKVPETSWTPQRSWDRIKPKKKRAAIFWWSGGSVAAVILLLIGYLWLFPQPNIQNNTIATHDLPEQEFDKVDTHVENILEEENKLVEGQLEENALADEGKVAEVEEPLKRYHDDISPAYMQPNFITGLLAKNDLNLDAPSKRNMQIDEDQKTEEKIAFNRVYVFKKNSGGKMTVDPTRPELAIRIDLTMKSSNEPPRGILAGLR